MEFPPFVALIMPYAAKNNPVKPIKPKPTTHKPRTAPPEKATCNARGNPASLAASAVLEFALVALSIPTKPAKALNAAPTIKQMALSQPTPSACLNAGINPKPIKTTAIIKMKGTIILNSRFKNVIAPLRIYSALLATLAFTTLIRLIL